MGKFFGARRAGRRYVMLTDANKRVGFRRRLLFGSMLTSLCRESVRLGPRPSRAAPALSRRIRFCRDRSSDRTSYRTGVECRAAGRSAPRRLRSMSKAAWKSVEHAPISPRPRALAENFPPSSVSSPLPVSLPRSSFVQNRSPIRKFQLSLTGKNNGRRSLCFAECYLCWL